MVGDATTFITHVYDGFYMEQKKKKREKEDEEDYNSFSSILNIAIKI